MTITISQQIVTVLMVVLGTVVTRFLPFALFPESRPVPKFVQYLGKYLPSAVISLLIVYCLKDVSFVSESHGIPELISIAVVALLHIWKKNMFLSIGAGTLLYMALVQFVF